MENEITTAYRDAEGWVLSNDVNESIEWPAEWPEEVDEAFLQARGIRIAA